MKTPVSLLLQQMQDLKDALIEKHPNEPETNLIVHILDKWLVSAQDSALYAERVVVRRAFMDGWKCHGTKNIEAEFDLWFTTTFDRTITTKNIDNGTLNAEP